MRARLVLVPILFVAALMAGCATNTPTPAATTLAPDNGVSALSADEILAKATTALGAATSFKVKGSATVEKAKVTMDLQYAGPNGQGTITTDGSTFEMVKIGTDLYLKASDDFWKSQIPADKQTLALALLKGKYVKVSTTNPAFSGLADVFDPKALMKPTGTVTKGAIGKTGGIDTVALIDSSDNQAIYIATRGEPVPVHMDGDPGDAGIDLTDFNKPTDIKAPSSDQVLDLTALLGG